MNTQACRIKWRHVLIFPEKMKKKLHLIYNVYIQNADVDVINKSCLVFISLRRHLPHENNG